MSSPNAQESGAAGHQEPAANRGRQPEAGPARRSTGHDLDRTSQRHINSGHTNSRPSSGQSTDGRRRLSQHEDQQAAFPPPPRHPAELAGPSSSGQQQSHSGTATAASQAAATAAPSSNSLPGPPARLPGHSPLPGPPPRPLSASPVLQVQYCCKSITIVCQLSQTCSFELTPSILLLACMLQCLFVPMACPHTLAAAHALNTLCHDLHS